MRYQDYIIRATEAAAAEFFRNLEGMPEDRIAWSPMDEGRSVLSMAQEIAMCPDWCLAVCRNEPINYTDPEVGAEQQRLMEAMSSIELCREGWRQRFSEYKTYVEGLSDEDLAATRWLPYGGGRDHTMEEMLDYPRWNCNYHTGQACYIQTLYGDRTQR